MGNPVNDSDGGLLVRHNLPPLAKGRFVVMIRLFISYMTEK
jgi:hypothetical protein